MIVRHDNAKVYTMEQNKKREIISLRMSEIEYEQVNALLVELTTAKRMPMTRADLLRDALNLKAVQVTGKQIFTEAAQ